MDFDPVFLSRLQFAFVISFHIIFPAFTIGLAAWLATIEGARLVSGNAIYRRGVGFLLRGVAVSFCLGGVAGGVVGVPFGTYWSGLAAENGRSSGTRACAVA